MPRVPSELDEADDLGRLARSGEGQQDVSRHQHPEVAVAGLAGVKEVGRRPGRGESRGDLLADQAGLADARDAEPPGGLLDGRRGPPGKAGPRLSIWRRTASASIRRTSRAASSDMARILRPQRGGPGGARQEPAACRYDRRAMSPLTQYVLTYGLPLIFGVVLLEQLGAPIPAIPVLIVAGALAVERDLAAWKVLLVAVGRLGDRGPALVRARPREGPQDPARRSAGSRSRRTPACGRPSRCSSAGGCPRCWWPSSSRAFRPSLPPWPARRGARVSSFLLYDAGGALLWAGAGVAAGMLFHRAIDRALSLLASLGSGALVVLGAALAVFVAFKWWQRRRFYQFLRMARITVDDLRHLIDAGKSPIVVDVRTAGGAERGSAADSGCGRHERRPGRRPRRGPAARAGDHPLLHVTQRSLSRPCGAHAHGQGIHAGAAARRRARGVDRGGASDRSRAADRDQGTSELSVEC